jgi:hypothetical protein
VLCPKALAEKISNFLKYRRSESGDGSVTQQTMKTNDPGISKGTQRELAGGVLKQAIQDLQRFHGATTGVERELYRDAYSWVMSDDCTWPFSFLNVCRLLNQGPDELREALLGDLSLGTFGQWARRGSRALRRLSDSLTGRLATHSKDSATTPASLMQTSY